MSLRTTSEGEEKVAEPLIVVGVNPADKNRDQNDGLSRAVKGDAETEMLKNTTLRCSFRTALDLAEGIVDSEERKYSTGVGKTEDRVYIRSTKRRKGVLLSDITLPTIPLAIKTAIESCLLLKEESDQEDLTYPSFETLFKETEGLDFSPELYLPILSQLNMLNYGNSVLPCRKFSYDYWYHVDADKSEEPSNSDDLKENVIDTLAAIGIRQPKDKPLAVILGVNGEGPYMFVASNDNIPKDVKTFYEEVWKRIQEVASCQLLRRKKMSTENNASKTSKNPTATEDKEDNLGKTLRKLMKLLVSFSIQKILHRIDKHLLDLDRFFNGQQKASDPTFENIRVIISHLRSASIAGNKHAQETDNKGKGRLLQTVSRDLFQGHEQWIKARKHIRKLQKALEIKESAKVNIDLNRYLQKAFAPVAHARTLEKLTMSICKRRKFLSKPMSVTLLLPQRRKIQKLSRIHVLTILCKSLAAGGRSGATITDIIAGKSTKKLLESLGLGDGESGAELSSTDLSGMIEKETRTGEEVADNFKNSSTQVTRPTDFNKNHQPETLSEFSIDPVHCECLALSTFMELRISGRARPYGYIGTSKPSCHFCSELFSIFNSIVRVRSKEMVEVRKGDRTVVVNTAMPSLRSSLDDEMRRCLVFKLGVEVENQLLSYDMKMDREE